MVHPGGMRRGHRRAATEADTERRKQQRKGEQDEDGGATSHGAHLVRMRSYDNGAFILLLLSDKAILAEQLVDGRKHEQREQRSRDLPPIIGAAIR